MSRRQLKALLTAAVLATVAASAAQADCQPGTGLAVSRIVQIDAATGPLYGDLSKFQRQGSFLKPKEVVLTFDDGPMPWITKSILDTLDRFCTKATFFSVGRMAIAYPETLRDVMRRGHTMGTHTWSHPMNIRRLSLDQSTTEIEKGIAAVAAAAGKPIAPFFRFPGLGDSGPMLTHLQKRGIASFTVDVVSNDSFIANADRLTAETLAKIESRHGGIVLFHDIKASTARALPGILSELQRRGYRVVHMVAKGEAQPDPRFGKEFAAQVAKATASPKKLMPFYGAVPPDKIARETGATIVALAPAAADYTGNARVVRTANRQSRAAVATMQPETSSWTTTVRRSYRPRVPNQTLRGGE